MPDFEISALFTGSTGEEAEIFISNELSKRGCTILDTNFSCPLGEIDIIASHKGVISFIEVKYRKSSHFGSPAEFVSTAKCTRIIKTAQWWLLHNKNKIKKNPVLSFDIAAISANSCEYLYNAYDTTLSP